MKSQARFSNDTSASSDNDDNSLAYSDDESIFSQNELAMGGRHGNNYPNKQGQMQSVGYNSYSDNINGGSNKYAGKNHTTSQELLQLLEKTSRSLAPLSAQTMSTESYQTSLHQQQQNQEITANGQIHHPFKSQNNAKSPSIFPDIKVNSTSKVNVSNSSVASGDSLHSPNSKLGKLSLHSEFSAHYALKEAEQAYHVEHDPR